MKKILIISIITVFGFTKVNAQEELPAYGFEFDNFIIEGNIGFNLDNSTNTYDAEDISENSETAFTINPKIGFFLEDNFAIGVELFYGNSDTESTTFGTPNIISKTEENTIGAGVFARYYFLNLGERFKTYTELGVGYESSKEEVSVSDQMESIIDTDSQNINAGLGIGINYFLTDRFAINFALTDLLSFKTGTTKDNLSEKEAETKTTSFNGNFNLFNNFFNTAQFGLTYKL
jgi:outer membrane protein